MPTNDTGYEGNSSSDALEQLKECCEAHIEEYTEHVEGNGDGDGDHDNQYYPREDLDNNANQPNWFVKVGADGKIPSNLFPANLDDVLSYANFTMFPITGEDGVLYIDRATNYGYRWSGVGYTMVTNPLALGETHETAFRGDWGKIAYDHTFLQNNPHNVTATQLGLGNVDNTSDLAKPISNLTQQALNGKEPAISTKLSAFNKNFGTGTNEVARGDHNHDFRYYTKTEIQDNYEPKIGTKNTAFNKNFGTGTNEVARGDHTHTLSELGINLNLFQPTSEKAQPNGYASLGKDGKVPISQLPDLNIPEIDTDRVNGMPVNDNSYDSDVQSILIHNEGTWDYVPFVPVVPVDFSSVSGQYGIMVVVEAWSPNYGV